MVCLLLDYLRYRTLTAGTATVQTALYLICSKSDCPMKF